MGASPPSRGSCDPRVYECTLSESAITGLPDLHRQADNHGSYGFFRRLSPERSTSIATVSMRVFYSEPARKQGATVNVESSVVLTSIGAVPQDQGSRRCAGEKTFVLPAPCGARGVRVPGLVITLAYAGQWYLCCGGCFLAG